MKTCTVDMGDGETLPLVLKNGHLFPDWKDSNSSPEEAALELNDEIDVSYEQSTRPIRQTDMTTADKPSSPPQVMLSTAQGGPDVNLNKTAILARDKLRKIHVRSDHPHWRP